MTLDNHDKRPSGAPLELLLVEDEPALRRLIGHHLDRLGCRVTSVRSAEDALDEMARTRPDVILLDLMLPGIDGLEFLRRLGRRTKTLPVIAMSAHAEIGVALEVLRLGALEFLQKPVDMEAFSHALERARERVGAAS